MSFTRIFFGVIVTSLGLAPPLGGGGGGGGGGAIARSTVFFGRSSCSMSQIVFIHIVKNKMAWNASIAVSSGAAHFGILRFLSAPKLRNIGPMAGRLSLPPAAFFAPSTLSFTNGVVFSESRVI